MKSNRKICMGHAKEGRLKEIKEMFDNCEIVSEDCKNLAYHALKFGKVEVAKYLIEDIGLSIDKNLHGIIQSASSKENFNVLHFLLDQGMDKEKMDEIACNNLYSTGSVSSLSNYCIEFKIDGIETLVRKWEKEKSQNVTDLYTSYLNEKIDGLRDCEKVFIYKRNMKIYDVIQTF